ncbi:FecR domain-containing protein [Synechococcus sp. 1G10]|uniref:FecR domain-containing protein n=1 Tax=Synechococcus sp. 1G10 TaxID=2025605 RepID=UPI00117C580E|nr:FecR domain-containing protein [Synechococcus sp. 1G10]
MSPSSASVGVGIPWRQPLLRLLAFASLVVPLLPTPLLAAEAATVREILDGKELFIDTRQAKVNDKAFTPQQVSTQNSRGQLAFPSGAAGRLNRFSLLRLGQDCFLLSKGQVLVSGKQAGCTRSSRLSVRGTNYLLSVDESGGSELSVLEGSVEVEPLSDGEPAPGGSTTVNAGEKVQLSPAGVVLTLLKLSSGDYSTILGGPLFEGFTTPLPAFGSLESYLRSNLPSVTIPSLPSAPSAPSIPFFGIPRFF